ncbi:hypothetical protein GN956_G12250 [Arapaima gigas]
MADWLLLRVTAASACGTPCVEGCTRQPEKQVARVSALATRGGSANRIEVLSLRASVRVLPGLFSLLKNQIIPIQTGFVWVWQLELQLPSGPCFSNNIMMMCLSIREGMDLNKVPLTKDPWYQDNGKVVTMFSKHHFD